MNLYLYLPSNIEYTENSFNKLKSIFNIKNVQMINSFPFNEEINNGILWINSHGFDRNSEHDFLIQGLTKDKIRKDYLQYFTMNKSGQLFIPSKNLSKLFLIKNSIILFDSCYSSEIDLRTLSNWKSNLIFTTGYIPDNYTIKWSGLIKAILYVADYIKKNKDIKTLDYNSIERNKETINNYFENVLNKQFKTQFILF